MSICFLGFSVFNIVYYYQLQIISVDNFDFLPVFILSVFVFPISYIFSKKIRFYKNLLHQKELSLRKSKEREIVLEKEKNDLINYYISIQKHLSNNIKKELLNALESENSKLKLKVREVILLLKDINQNDNKLQLSSLKNQNILLNSEFKVLLKQQFTTLSKSELDLCILIKLGFDTEYILEVLNINKNSLYVRKHRIKKKLGTDNLYVFLLNLKLT